MVTVNNKKNMNTNVLKRGARKIVAWIYYIFGLHRFQHKGNVLILMYHRVLRDNDEIIKSVQPGMYVTDSSFKKQVKYLTRHFEVISLKELLKLWEGEGLDNNKKYCVITFDDGWLDNYLYAYPVLREYSVPATIFLTTTLIGTNRWFWPEKLSYIFLEKHEDLVDAASSTEDVEGEVNDVMNSIFSIMREKYNYSKRSQMDFIIGALKRHSEIAIENALSRMCELLHISIPDERMLLNWDEVKEMSTRGISFGSHTCNHKILTGLSLDEANIELGDSMKALKEKDIEFSPVFCYPNGNYNKEIQEAVSALGYEAAVTTKFGFESAAPDDYFEIKRVGVHDDIGSTVPLFSFHLSGLRHKFQ